MATVQFIDGRIVEGVKLSDVEYTGDEGARRAVAHYENKEYPVYNHPEDGSIWYEQMSLETYELLKGSSFKFVEGSSEKEKGEVSSSMQIT